MPVRVWLGAPTSSPKQSEAVHKNPNDPTPIQSLTKEDLSGDLLQAGILGYFASVDGADQLAARAGKQVVAYRLPSIGSFSAKAEPHLWFGIVKSVSFPGVVMDIDRVVVQVAAKDDDKAKRIAYIRQIGAAGSAFEHAVPERLFADPNKPAGDPSQPQGISAVKALALAAGQGQKVYTLNAQNQAYHAGVVAGLGTDAETKAEIANALAAGLEVTVHQADITAYGWTGSGYIILDPESGAGAYKISGGANGAFYYLVSALASFFLIPVGLLAFNVSLGVGAVLALGAALIFGLSKFVDKVNSILASDVLTQEQKDGWIKVSSTWIILTNVLAFLKIGAEAGDVIAATIISITGTGIMAFADGIFWQLLEWLKLNSPSNPEANGSP